VDLLSVAHHGSKDALLPRLLERIRPRFAAISVGAGNPFGHPTAETLRALDAAGAEVRRTDRRGDVWLRSEDRGPVFGSG
jgi:competence protein ComEC